MKNFKISVVVNIYNLDFFFVKRSIDSIKNQKYDNFECIIIDDGSQPKYKYDDYFKTLNVDKHFKYIYHDNIGLGPSRNVGIRIATGDYILFLDGDDYYRSDAFQFINNVFNLQQADVLHFNYAILDNNSLEIKPKISESWSYKKNLKNNIMLSDFKQIQGNKFVFKLSFLISNSIFYYNENIIHEDVYFCLIFKNLMNDIIFSDNEIYFYDTTRENSITNTDRNDNYTTFIDNIELAFLYLSKHNNLNELFYLYVIYYLNKFIGNTYKRCFADKLFLNNQFLKNKIGICKYHSIMFFCYRNIIFGKLFSTILSNKNILNFLKRKLLK